MPYKEKADRRAFDLRRRKAVYDMVEEWFRTHSCVDCGNSDRRVLEPDHVKGKNFTIGNRGQRTIEQVKAELELCESRCANCHKIRHWKERQK